MVLDIQVPDTRFFENPDWLSFRVNDTFEYQKNEIKYIGDPKLHWTDWDYGNVANSPGPHMICDLNGSGLKWSDVKNGMQVKIKAKNLHHPDYEWLYSSEGAWGNVSFIMKIDTAKNIFIHKALLILLLLFDRKYLLRPCR